jgi:hypothetical protein
MLSMTSHVANASFKTAAIMIRLTLNFLFFLYPVSSLYLVYGHKTTACKQQLAKKWRSECLSTL